jgi:BASS family bile acid:Na+ symporter
MDALKEFIPLILAASLFALVLTVGLDAEIDELLALFARPLRLLKAVLAVNVIVPVAACLLIAAFPIPYAAKVGILLMAVSPVPPLVPGKELKVGARRRYSYSAYTALIILAVVVVPVSLALLSALYEVDVNIPAAAVARNVAVSVVLPLAIGLGIQRLAPAFAARVAPAMRGIATITLVLAFVPLIIAAWPQFVPLMRGGTLLVMALVAVVALLGGHVLGGPNLHERAALAVTAATRHPGIAMMIAAANANDPHVTAAILGFMIVGMVAAAPYQLLIKRQLAKEATPG